VSWLNLIGDLLHLGRLEAEDYLNLLGQQTRQLIMPTRKLEPKKVFQDCVQGWKFQMKSLEAFSCFSK
jgi:hypothetical protein